jgi:hypothetical protein
VAHLALYLVVLGVNRQSGEADHSPPFGAMVKDGAIPPRSHLP